MNIQESDIICRLAKEPFTNQRLLSEASGHSLGVVNRCLRELEEEGYLDKSMALTAKAKSELEEKSPRRAIILAAGFGMRMVPINTEIPKGLLEIKGEPLIERLIKQLKQAGIKEIYVVAGFMKEKYEYLIDEYNIKLIINREYSRKNNLYSLSLAADHLSNAYIIPCDIWCDSNPFSEYELYSWYMVSDMVEDESTVRVNRKRELVLTAAGDSGNAMIGIAYISKESASEIKKRIEDLSRDKNYENAFWEEALYNDNKMRLWARVINSEGVFEINTFEQLRELDADSNQLKTDAIRIIAEVFKVTDKDIKDITVLKKGMTNRSFLFSCKGRKYIMRIPGEGTGELINRRQEGDVYEKIKGQGICDDIIYFNSENGYKITEFLKGARVCDPLSEADLVKAMAKLRELHGMKLKVAHEFDIFGQIEFYESLWKGRASMYKDYNKTKNNVYRLKGYIDKTAGEKFLTHIDAVPDNFLFIADETGNEQIRLIDWEYAGMQDPHVDIAMFCIYSMYSEREQIDRLIDIYFEGDCSRETRIKIYCYIAACGLLWSNWCEYKSSLGVEFGEYSIRQYRYAKDYYRIAAEEMAKEEQNV